jgi:hypothetical protein
MITLLNNRVKRGARQCSIIFNGFENKAKYGAGYMLRLGMVLIQMDILMRRNHGISDAIKKNYKQKEKK